MCGSCAPSTQVCLIYVKFSYFNVNCSSSSGISLLNQYLTGCIEAVADAQLEPALLIKRLQGRLFERCLKGRLISCTYYAQVEKASPGGQDCRAYCPSSSVERQSDEFKQSILKEEILVPLGFWRRSLAIVSIIALLEASEVISEVTMTKAFTNQHFDAVRQDIKFPADNKNNPALREAKAYVGSCKRMLPQLHS